MPTLNSDGSINTSTDGSWDWDNDKVFKAACGLIAGSMVLPKPKRANKPIVRSVEPCLFACWSERSHFSRGTQSSEGWTDADNQFSPGGNYTKYKGNAKYTLQPQYDFKLSLVNTTDESITFDTIELYLSNGAFCMAPAARFQPWIAGTDHAHYELLNDFWMEQEDAEKLQGYFADSSADVYRPLHVTLYSYTEITIGSNQTLAVLKGSVYPQHSVTVYKDGTTPLQLQPNFFSQVFRVEGSKVYNPWWPFTTHVVHHFGQQETVTSVESHCAFSIIDGSRWYEDWNKEYPGHYWTREPEGQTAQDAQRQEEARVATTTVTFTFKVSTTSSRALLTIKMYGTEKKMLVPPDFDGLVEYVVEVPPQIAMTDNTVVELSTEYSITIESEDADDESSAYIVDAVIENNPEIADALPPSFTTEDRETLKFSDSVFLLVQQAPNPEATDNLILTDDAFVVHSMPPANPDISDNLVLADDADIHQIIPVTPDTEDGLTLADDADIQQIVPVTPNKIEQLVLSDSATINNT